MPDPTPAVPAVTPPAETPPAATVPPVTPPEPAKEPEKWDEDRARRTIEAQRASETALKAKNAELQAKADKLAELEAAQLSESERVQKERDEALAKVADADRKIREAHLLAALSKPELGLASAQAAAKLIEGVTYDDSGEPTNLAERVEALLDTNAFLKATPAAPAPAPNINGGGGATPAAPPTLTVDEARAAQEAGMDPARFAFLKGLKDAPNQLEAWQQFNAAANKT